MATTLYLTDNDSDLDALAYHKKLDFARGAGVVSDTAVSNTDAFPATTEWINESGNIVAWYSPPLAAVTLTGTITINMRGLELNMAANQQFYVAISRVNGTTGAHIEDISVTIVPGAELGTSEAAQNWTSAVAGGSKSISAGDRIKVQVGLAEIGTGAGGHTGTLFYGGTSAGASGNSFVTFTETITEDTGLSVSPAALALAVVAEAPARIDQELTPGALALTMLAEAPEITPTIDPGSIALAWRSSGLTKSTRRRRSSRSTSSSSLSRPRASTRSSSRAPRG